MPQIADYHVVSDGAFPLSNQGNAPDDKTITFSVPSGFNQGGSVLSWRMHVVNGNNLKYNVTLNNQEVWDTPGSLFDGEQMMVLQEVVSGSAFIPGSQQQLTFQVRAGQGTVYISDVVLLCQVNT